MKIKITLIILLFFPVIVFGQWSQVTNFPTSGRYSTYCLPIQGKVYIGSGFNYPASATIDNQEYNPVTNIWVVKSVPPFSARMGTFSFVIGNYGYVGLGSSDGGSTVFNDVWRYNAVTDTWLQMANFPGSGRIEAAAFVINGKAYVISGVNSAVTLIDCWEYNPTTNNWTAKATPPAGFTPGYVTGFSYGNYGYVGLGGFNSSSSNDFWRFDPVANSWMQLANLPVTPQTRTWTISGGDLIAGKGFVGLGGFSSASNNDFWAYDFMSDTWQSTASIYNFPSPLLSGKTFDLYGERYVGIGSAGGGTINTGIYKFSCLTIPPNLQNGLLAYYPFNGGSLGDFSGNGHNLLNTTTAISASDRNGNTNCAFEFDNLPNSNNEFLTTTNTTFLNGLSEFTVSCWYQPLDITRSAGAYESLISRDLGVRCPDRSGQWSLGLYDCRRSVFARENSVWDLPGNTCDVAINTGTWHHLTATYNQAGNTIKLYKDGVLQGTETGVANCSTVTPTTLDIGDLFLGKYFTGRIDDVFIHNRELNVTEVNQLYTLGSSCCSGNVLSIEDKPIPKKQKIKIYPNPTSDLVYLETTENIVSITVYELNGRVVIHQNSSDKKIDISYLNRGIYILKTDTNKGVFINKVIKR